MKTVRVALIILGLALSSGLVFSEEPPEPEDSDFDKIEKPLPKKSKKNKKESSDYEDALPPNDEPMPYPDLPSIDDDDIQ